MSTYLRIPPAQLQAKILAFLATHKEGTTLSGMKLQRQVGVNAFFAALFTLKRDGKVIEVNGKYFIITKKS